jgi:hypothetical protein
MNHQCHDELAAGKQVSQMGILDLPNELLSDVASFLNASSMLDLRKTNSAIKEGIEFTFVSDSS